MAQTYSTHVSVTCEIGLFAVSKASMNKYLQSYIIRFNKQAATYRYVHYLLDCFLFYIDYERNMPLQVYI